MGIKLFTYPKWIKSQGNRLNTDEKYLVHIIGWVYPKQKFFCIVGIGLISTRQTIIWQFSCLVYCFGVFFLIIDGFFLVSSKESEPNAFIFRRSNIKLYRKYFRTLKWNQLKRKVNKLFAKERNTLGCFFLLTLRLYAVENWKDLLQSNKVSPSRRKLTNFSQATLVKLLKTF